MQNDTGERGGWSNPASAENGKQGGRPREKGPTFRRGEQLLLERQSLGSDLNPFHKPKRAVVLSVSNDEIELQIGDDLLVIRRPDENGM